MGSVFSHKKEMHDSKHPSSAESVMRTMGLMLAYNRIQIQSFRINKELGLLPFFYN